MRSLSIALSCLAVAGCDDLSTSVVSRASPGARFQWHDKEATEWSVAFEMPIDRPQSLMHALFRSISDIAVTDGVRHFQVGSEQMARFHKVCDRGPQCAITYLGGGRLRVVQTSGS